MADYLVTGGAGFIGSNLVHTLHARGDSVRVLDNLTTGLPQNLADIRSDIDLVEGDFRDRATVDAAMKGVKRVIHIGALPSVSRSVEDPGESNAVNITGTLNLLESARDAGVERFVFSSSSSVYGNTPTLPKEESMTPSPLSPYALQKLAGEHYCRIFHELYGLNTYALRYFNVFGPRQNPASQYAAVLPLFIGAGLRGEAPVIHGDGGQTRDFTYVEDVVRANLCCCEASEDAAGGAYNVAWGNRLSVLDLATLILKQLGRSDIEPVHVESRAGDVRDSQADNTRARTLLGWDPQVTFEEGLAQLL